MGAVNANHRMAFAVLYACDAGGGSGASGFGDMLSEAQYFKIPSISVRPQVTNWKDLSGALIPNE